MEKYEFILAIVAIVMFASVLRARYGYVHRRRRGQEQIEAPNYESERLKDEVRTLKERIAVLERIATDKESTLEREIERLRDR